MKIDGDKAVPPSNMHQKINKEAFEEVTLEDSANLKKNLLLAFLEEVDRAGWTHNALLKAAAKLNIDSTMVWALFPEKEADALCTWSRFLNQQLAEKLSSMDLQTMKVRRRIFWAVRTRLQLMTPHKKAARASWHFLCSPKQALLATRITYDVVHTTWSLAGDTSTDYNFYTKRLLLGGVYTATFYYWLNDTSPDHLDTARFLENRINDVLKLQMLKHIKANFSGLKSVWDIVTQCTNLKKSHAEGKQH